MPVPAVSHPKPQSRFDHHTIKQRPDADIAFDNGQDISRHDASDSSPQQSPYQSALPNPIQISPTREMSPLSPSLSIQSKHLASPLALSAANFTPGGRSYDMLVHGHAQPEHESPFHGSPFVSRSISAGTRASPRLGSPFSTASTAASFSSRQNRRSSVGGIGSFVGSYEVGKLRILTIRSDS